MGQFTSLTAAVANGTINTSSSSIAIPLTDILTHYTAYIGKTSSNEVLVGVSDTDAAWSSLSLRTQTLTGITDLTSSQQQGIAAGNNRVNHIFFRRAATKPSSPSVIYTSDGYSPEVTSSSDWQINDPDSSSSDPLWMAFAQSTYDSDSDVWTQTTWTVISADSGFDIEYSHSLDSSGDHNWHEPPLHDTDHSTPDTHMRFRVPGSTSWSAAIRIVDIENPLEWTEVMGRQYFAPPSTTTVDTKTFTSIQLAQFTELMLHVEFFGGWTSGQPSNLSSIFTLIIPRELSRNQWELAPNTASGAYNNGYTYRVRLNDIDASGITWRNSEEASGDIRNQQTTFFMQLRRANTLSTTGQDTVANAAIFFGYGQAWQHMSMKLYGR